MVFLEMLEGNMRCSPPKGAGKWKARPEGAKSKGVDDEIEPTPLL